MKIVLLTARLHSPGVLALCRTMREYDLGVTEIVCARHPKDSVVRHWIANSLFVRAVARRLRPRTDMESQTGILCELRAAGIPFRFFSQSLNSAKVVRHLKRIQPDFLVNFRGPIYRRPLIETARQGLVNWHMALLPEFRGMNVAEWSILHGYPTGATVHFIDPGIDTGDILAFFTVPVGDCRTVEAVRETLFGLQYDHVARAIRLFVDGAIHRTPQRRQSGKQYFTMHDRINEKVAQSLAAGYEPTVDISDRPYVFRNNTAT